MEIIALFGWPVAERARVAGGMEKLPVPMETDATAMRRHCFQSDG
jgi:hypothetical protein